jgi:uncharacterized membrane protein (DUF2068 family)
VREKCAFLPEGLTLTICLEARQLEIRFMSEQAKSGTALQNKEELEEQAAAHHDRGLLAIGLFKLGKALLFFCLGVGAFHLLHKDLDDEMTRLTSALGFDSDNRIVALLAEKIDLIDEHRLKEIGFATFAYAALALTEGVGLMLEKVWAEYLTLTLTVSFLPWELYELARRPNLFRFSLLVINLLVLGYLVWYLQRKRQRKAERAVFGAKS